MTSAGYGRVGRTGMNRSPARVVRLGPPATLPCRTVGFLRPSTKAMELDRTRPLWRQIAAEIIRRIQDGTYRPGSHVPSTLESAREFDVLNATAAKAMRHVREQGWTRGEVGLGTFVVDPLPPSATSQPSTWKLSAASTEELESGPQVL